MTSTSASVRYRFGLFELQPEERRLLADGVAVRIGPHAFDLLAVLVERSGHLVTKNELLARVWQQVVVEENTLQAHIATLRKVLGADAISTVSGRGYRFIPEVACVDASTSDVPARKHNLPHELTSFVGREKEIAQISELMASTRLLTLTGAGGCGKTRLAMKVAGAMLEAYRDGVWLVELAPLGNPALVVQTVANALAVKEQVGKDLTETVAEGLESKHLLLVLDNAEHLLGACAQLADLLLRRCGKLAILVTSRERLGIAGESTYRVPSLSVPDPRQPATNGEALACEAARLFIDRARLQRPDLDIGSKDAAAVASICSRLDGIALAIELAAPRMRFMSVEELSRRLDDRFDVLTGGSRTALPRHRTLRALIDWSYDLLNDAEKTMLRRASVFAGGWTAEAAECVCSGENVDRSEVLDLLTSLTDKNLLAAEPHDDVARFGMLDTVRQYAQDKLRDEETATRARHVAYFGDLAYALNANQTPAQRQVKLNRLDMEHDNIRAALAWCAEDVGRSVSGLYLAGRLDSFWRTRGHFSEGRSWITGFLAAVPIGEEAAARAKGCNAAGALAYVHGDYAAAESHFRESYALYEQLGNRTHAAAELGNLGTIMLARSDFPAAREFYEKSLIISRESGDQPRIASKLRSLGLLAFYMGELARAQALLEDSVAIDRESAKASESIRALGQVRHAQGNNKGARALLSEALQRQRDLGDKGEAANTLISLGMVSHDEGDIAAAMSQLREALSIQQAIGDRINVCPALEAFAGVLLESAGPLDAARIWGGVEHSRQELGSPPYVPERMRLDRQVAAARSALSDDAAFDQAWHEGRSMTLDDLLRYALNM